MEIPQEKRDFIKKVIPGIIVYLQSDNRLQTILKNPKCEIEMFITNYLYDCNYDVFAKAIDTLVDEKLVLFLTYFDANDMPLCDVYVESRISLTALSIQELEWVTKILAGELETFEKFLIN